MLAAIAGELFPLMLNEDPGIRMGGVTIGFILGLGTIHGVEYIISSYEDDEDSHSDAENALVREIDNKMLELNTYDVDEENAHHSHNPIHSHLDKPVPSPESPLSPNTNTALAVFEDRSIVVKESPNTMDKKRYEGVWEPDQVEVSAEVIQSDHTHRYSIITVWTSIISHHNMI